MNSIVDIFIFRHGETDWNKERRFQGHTDIPLNQLGRDQARRLTPLLAHYKPELILCSDLIRAKETAQIANSILKAPVLESDALRECQLGDSEGLLLDKILEIYGHESMRKWQSTSRDDDNFGFPNGETKKMHLERVKNYIESFLFKNPHYRSVAISTHGGSLRRLVHHSEGAPTEPIPIPNCCLYKLQFDFKKNKWIFQGEVI
ncbi:MAG: phosphoglycerate mutase [Oligoflexia bacterium]|nr:MAG: phosphoglycerate mutase [Oligoflexia bacterium]